MGKHGQSLKGKIYSGRFYIMAVIVLGIIALVLSQISSIDVRNQQMQTLPSASASAITTSTVVASASPTPTSVSSELTSSSLTTESSNTAPSITSTAATTATTATAPTASPSVEPAPQARPTHLTVTGPGVKVDAIVKGMPYNVNLVPESCSKHPKDVDCPNTAYWVEDSLGTAPGSDANKSTFILGHAWGEDFRVFNTMSNRALDGLDFVQVKKDKGCEVSPRAVYPITTLNGDVAKVSTIEGSLSYVVYDAFAVCKDNIANVASIWAATPNRLVLIACATSADGLDYDYNVVVYAQLASSSPAKD